MVKSSEITQTKLDELNEEIERLRDIAKDAEREEYVVRNARQQTDAEAEYATECSKRLLREKYTQEFKAEYLKKIDDAVQAELDGIDNTEARKLAKLEKEAKKLMVDLKPKKTKKKVETKQGE